MTMATGLQRIILPVAAVALAVTPLANPLLVALAVVAGGLLLAYRCATDLLALGLPTTDAETVFRHFV